jgi:hypothetical protein
MSNPRGRPTDYNDTIIEKANHYIENFDLYDDAVPQIASLALALGVHRDTLYEWAKDPEKSEFSDILETVMAKQEKTLVNGSLRGEMNPAISKMMLTKHGYSDKQEIDTNLNIKDSVDLSQLSEDELRKLIEMQHKSRTI